MNKIKNSLYLLAIVGLFFTTACGDDDESSVPASSVSLSVGDVEYAQSSGEDVYYFDSSFDDETSVSISGTTNNGTDTVFFEISLPSLSAATYNKETDGDEVSVYIELDSEDNPNNNFSFDTDGPLSSSIDDLTSYSVEITAVTENSITGTFTATVQDGFSDETRDVEGSFVAVDGTAALFDELEDLFGN